MNQQLEEIKLEIRELRQEVKDKGHGWSSFWLFMIWLTLELGYIWVRIK